MNRCIETLRGFACVLLVLYHVIGADPSDGLRVSEGVARWLNDGLAYLRMPLFTFLSGMVYGLRPFSGDSRRFLLGKCRRLLVPMLVVGTAFAVIQSLVPGTNNGITNWWLLHVEPVAHFWFLESLFWVFLLVWLLERFQLISTPGGLATACMLAAALYLTAPGGYYLFSIEGAFYLLPYFMFGMAVTRRNLWPLMDVRGVQTVLLVLVLVAAWQIGPPVPHINRRTLWVLVIGLALCHLCLVPRLEVRWLSRIGTSSYAIYLFHVFFTAATRIGLARAGLVILPLQIVLGVLAGVLGPMLIDRWASRYRWPSLLLLGKSLSRSKAAHAPVAD